MIRMPPANSFDSMVLPESRDLAGRTNSRSAGLSSIRGSMRWRELRFASSTVGWTAKAGPGAWWMMNPMKQLAPSVAPTWAAFMNTTRRHGSAGDSASMMARM